MGQAVVLWPHSDCSEPLPSTAVVGSCVGSAFSRAGTAVQRPFSALRATAAEKGLNLEAIQVGIAQLALRVRKGRQIKKKTWKQCASGTHTLRDRRRNRFQSFIRHLDVGLVTNLTIESKSTSVRDPGLHIATVRQEDPTCSGSLARIEGRPALAQDKHTELGKAQG